MLWVALGTQMNRQNETALSNIRNTCLNWSMSNLRNLLFSFVRDAIWFLSHRRAVNAHDAGSRKYSLRAYTTFGVDQD